MSIAKNKSFFIKEKIYSIEYPKMSHQSYKI